jgi:hypothetical protein
LGRVNIVQRRLRQILRDRGDRWGTKIELASEIGVSGPFLTQVMNGRKLPGPKILAYLGLEARQAYRTRRTPEPVEVAP